MAGFNRAKNSAATANPGYGVRHGGLVHFTTCVSGNAQKDRGGTILNGGNITTGGQRPTVTYNLSLATDLFDVRRISGKVIIAGGTPNQSGNLGTIKPLSATNFGKMVRGQYVAMVIGTQIAGVANSVLNIPGSEFAGLRKHGFTYTPTYKYQYLSISAWNYETGRATYSGLQGLTVTLPLDSGATGMGQGNPGWLTYLQGGLIPLNTQYKVRTNW